MPTSTKEFGRDRRLLLESLRAFSRGDWEAPLINKWTNSVDAGISIDGGSAAKAAAKDSGAEAITFVLSTGEIDRHGDVISADGWVLDSYRDNRALLWAHDYRHPAIGRAAKWWNEPHRLLADMELAPTDFSREIACLYRSGFQ